VSQFFSGITLSRALCADKIRGRAARRKTARPEYFEKVTSISPFGLIGTRRTNFFAYEILMLARLVLARSAWRRSACARQVSMEKRIQ
jgi:hypothetical protein